MTAIVRLKIFDAFAAAEPMWRELERAAPVATPYQRFQWLWHWFTHVGRSRGAEPVIVVGFDGYGAPGLILPLFCESRHGCRVAGFGGDRHSNLNMAAWRADVGFAGDAVSRLLAEIAVARDIDLFALLAQPRSFAGARNPFAALAGQPSPDDVFSVSLAGAPAPLRLPSGMRKKQRRLRALPGYRFVAAETPSEVERILEVFWPQKAARFNRLGIRNVFADAPVRNFIRGACLDGLSDSRPAIELYAVEGAGETLAVIGGVSSAARFSVMFNSVTASAGARFSPGIILMAELIGLCARRGIVSFDLGAGQAPYKTLFCSASEQRFDCFVPYSARGRALAAASALSVHVRRSLKNSAALMNAWQGARRWLTAMRRG